jgi:hypothetical protein
VFIRIGEEGFEEAAGRTADPSAALGMTRGEERPRLEWLVDGENCRFFRCVELRWQRCGDREIKQWMMQRGLWARIGEEGFERAAGHTADPSASLGMTRGEERPRLEWLVDGENADSSAALSFGGKVVVIGRFDCS